MIDQNHAVSERESCLDLPTFTFWRISGLQRKTELLRPWNHQEVSSGHAEFRFGLRCATHTHLRKNEGLPVGNLPAIGFVLLFQSGEWYPDSFIACGLSVGPAFLSRFRHHGNCESGSTGSWHIEGLLVSFMVSD